MSEEEAERRERREDPGESAVQMRRSLLGYNRADVERALGERDEAVGALEHELDSREAELAELRQDVAALWLAFAQHDRMLRALQGTAPAGEVPPTPDPAAAGAAEPELPSEPSEAEPPSVGNQLAELDEVLAAIEMATQTLERTYADEIAESAGDDPGQGPSELEEDPPGTAATPERDAERESSDGD
ncbi:MAG: hypothetical protein U0R24_13130 [Solirubrobacterales bacterium]